MKLTVDHCEPVAGKVGLIDGWARMPLRPLLFTSGWLCILAIAASVLLA